MDRNDVLQLVGVSLSLALTELLARSMRIVKFEASEKEVIHGKLFTTTWVVTILLFAIQYWTALSQAKLERSGFPSVLIIFMYPVVMYCAVVFLLPEAVDKTTNLHSHFETFSPFFLVSCAVAVIVSAVVRHIVDQQAFDLQSNVHRGAAIFILTIAAWSKTWRCLSGKPQRWRSFQWVVAVLILILMVLWIVLQELRDGSSA